MQTFHIHLPLYNRAGEKSLLQNYVNYFAKIMGRCFLQIVWRIESIALEALESLLVICHQRLKSSVKATKAVAQSLNIRISCDQSAVAYALVAAIAHFKISNIGEHFLCYILFQGKYVL